MAVNKAIVQSIGGTLDILEAFVGYYDDGTRVESFGTSTSLTGITSAEQLKDAIQTEVLSYASTQGYSALTADEIIWATLPSRSFANPSRSLNSAFQISATRDAQVSYSIDVACSASLVGGQTGTVFLEYADDSGFTTNVKEAGRQVNGNSVSLAIAVTLNQNVTATVTGMIPKGKYVRIRTANTTGTPTFNFRSAQEVLL